MDSTNLKEMGFTECVQLVKLTPSDLPYQGGLFVLLDRSIQGGSDIIYIGRAKNLVKRIFGGVLGGRGGKTSRRIHEMLFGEGALSKAEISWMTTDKLKAGRDDLLQKYKQEYGKLPDWN